MSLSIDFWISVATIVGYTTIIALGQYVCMSGGTLSVASAAMAGAGAYSGGYASIHYGVPLVVAVAAGGLVGFALGAALGYLTVRLHELVAGLMSLAFAEVMVVTALNIDAIGGANGLSGVPLVTEVWMVWLAVALILFGIWRMEASDFGFAVRACRDDLVAASAHGINVALVKSLVFGFGSGLAAIGGVLAVHYTSVELPSDLGFFAGLNYLIFVIFGGSYVMWGAVIGAGVLTILPEALRFSSTDRYILYGLVLTLFVILRPQGLVTRRALAGVAALGRRRSTVAVDSPDEDRLPSSGRPAEQAGVGTGPAENTGERRNS